MRACARASAFAPTMCGVLLGVVSFRRPHVGREHARRMLAVLCVLSFASTRTRVHDEKPNESDYWCAGVLRGRARA